MPTKPCFCLSFGCKGKPQDIRVARRHAEEDRSQLSRQAEAQASQALEEEEGRIAEYIASRTLAGQVDGDSSGGTLWGKGADKPPPSTPQEDRPHTKKSAHDSSSHRKRVRRVLEYLGEVDVSVSSYCRGAENRLKCFQLPCSLPAERAFPLESLLKDANSLRHKILPLTLRTPATIATYDSIMHKLENARSAVEGKRDLWERCISKLSDSEAQTHTNCIRYDTAHHYKPILETADPFLQVLFLMILTLSILYHLPRAACGFALDMVRYALQLHIFSRSPSLSIQDQNLLAGIPSDPRTVLNKFELEGKYTVYAVCPHPRCHTLHAPTFTSKSPIPIYPSRCTHRRFRGGKRCSQPLLRPKVVAGACIETPIKTYVAFSFKDWVTNLISCPGMEDKMDAAWGGEVLPDGGLRDIFDGSVLKEFRGPDGQLFSLNTDEGRYVFSLSVDFFNPLGNKQSGKTISVGILSVVCLNLPPELRYKAENMFLAGLIPGPSEPPTDCINHYLQPLISEFLEFWDPGVFASRTHRHPTGRLVRCALVLVVCDLPAARKTSGFAAVTHDTFCSVCKCRKNKDGYVNRPYVQWERRTQEECRQHAKLYRDATSDASQQTVFDSHGIRWSELLRLPYFDPSSFVVVDAMHNLFLGLIHEHIRGILGINPSPIPAKKALHISLDEAWHSYEDSIKTGIRYLKNALEGSWTSDPMYSEVPQSTIINRLGRRKKDSLAYIAKQVGVYPESTDDQPPKPTKEVLAQAIVLWRMQQVEEPADLDPLPLGNILTADECKAIREDIASMVTPSWLSSVPSDLGAPRHGKLKADQWRVLGTVYFPISLFRLWAKLEGDDEDTVLRRRLLQVTMSLLSAIAIASSHVSSPARADLYISHLQSYISGIKDLFPDYQFRPNHHMAFHIRDYLLMYGPVHSWWSFPFERLIGVVQRIPNNHKPAEYEETISRSFTRSSNLLRLLQKSHCPPAMQKCRSFFDRLGNTQVHNGAAVTDLLGLQPSRLFGQAVEVDQPEEADQPDEIVEVLSAWAQKAEQLPETVISALRHSKIDLDSPRFGKHSSTLVIRGLTYTVATRHRGNSQAMVSLTPNSPPTPAILRYIFQATVGGKLKTFLAVEGLQNVTAAADPALAFPLLKMGIYSEPSSPVLTIVDSDSVICHFARLTTVFEGKHDVSFVVSLSRT